MSTGKRQGKAPSSCKECEHWTEIRNKLRVDGILATVLEKMETHLGSKEFKPTLADYFKLVQLEKEIGEEEAKEIRVTWVEPAKSSTET